MLQPHESLLQTGQDAYIHFLSILTLAREELRLEVERCLGDLEHEQQSTILAIASAHHVILRALDVQSSEPASSPYSGLMEAEHERGQHAIRSLHEVCQAMENNGYPVVVIKSLDHYPDMGTDLDLLTCAPETSVINTMRNCFGASIEAPTLSDRVARKLNFRLPDLPELVEIHFGRLGQAGEHVKLADRIIERRKVDEFAGKSFFVPAPEDRILLTTLQRLYCHFYIRVCDFVDTANLLNFGAIDFEELRKAANGAGIWSGVATFLQLVSDYVRHYRGEPIYLPRRVQSASRFSIEKIVPNAGFLRLPLFPQSAELYFRQLVKTLRRRDTAGGARLGLIPPLALAASLRYKLTGNEHGIW